MLGDKQTVQRLRYKKRSMVSKAIRREFRISRARDGAKARISHTHGPALEQARDEIADYLARNPTPKVY